MRRVVSLSVAIALLSIPVVFAADESVDLEAVTTIRDQGFHHSWASFDCGVPVNRGPMASVKCHAKSITCEW